MDTSDKLAARFDKMAAHLKKEQMRFEKLILNSKKTTLECESLYCEVKAMLAKLSKK